MLDLTGSPALDLAIGLSFVFFLLATLASAIHEFIAAALGLRARTLEQGLRCMLEDPETGWNLVDDFYDHDLIRSLYRTAPAIGEAARPKAPDPISKLTDEVRKARIALSKAGTADEKEAAAADLQEKTSALHKARGKGRNAAKAQDRRVKRARAFFSRTSGPSYISPRAFAAAMFDNLFPAVGAKNVFTEADDLVGDLPPALALRLKPLIDAAHRDVEELRTNLERWFDDTMARVSGWYKRKSQIILLVIGALIVPAINANALVIGATLWRDSAIRGAVVAQAQNAVATPSPPGSATPTPTPTPTPTGTPSAADNAKAAADAVEDVKQVGVPLGWRGVAVPHHFWSWVTMILGWLLTIAAISLGAPFWFDFLGRVARLRSTGKPETPLPATGSGKPNERVK